MRIALYARISTDGKGQDEANQLAQLTEFVAHMPDWTLHGQYIDRVTGSGSKERPEYNRMFEDARRRRFDLLLFWSLDRFSREGVLETLNALNLLTTYGCGWRSLTEQYLDSTGIFREAVIAILAAVAKQERIRISERTKAGLARVKAAGRRLGRPEVVVDKPEVRRLRLAGYSVRQIAVEMGLKRNLIHETLVAMGLNGPVSSSAPGETAADAPGRTRGPETIAAVAPEVCVPGAAVPARSRESWQDYAAVVAPALLDPSEDSR
jgi:DNA invertase Pin-like site-specific DNA recombinase